MKRTALLIIGLGTIAGCAAPVPLAYKGPAASLQPRGPVIACRGLAEQRSDRSIDAAITDDSLSVANQAVLDSVVGAGIASKVEQIPLGTAYSGSRLRAQGVTIVLEPQLDEMRWEVPDYDSISLTSFAIGVPTLGIGSLIYGSTSTDVYGRVKLKVRMVDLKSQVERTGTYVGTSKDNMSKMSSNDPETQSRLVAQALRSATDQFAADLRRFAGW